MIGIAWDGPGALDAAVWEIPRDPLGSQRNRVWFLGISRDWAVSGGLFGPFTSKISKPPPITFIIIIKVAYYSLTRCNTFIHFHLL